MRATIRFGAAACVLVALLGCFGPEDRRPGMRLPGDRLAATPSDWGFTNDHKEIAIEVQTPYLLPHSVTIWCAEVDGALYVGARNPESKHWPGWVDRNPEVRLGIGSDVFEVRLVPLDDPARIDRVRRAYAAKYALPEAPAEAGPPIRYWRVEARG